MRAGSGIMDAVGGNFLMHVVINLFDNMTIQLIYTALRHCVYIISPLSPLSWILNQAGRGSKNYIWLDRDDQRAGSSNRNGGEL